MRYAINYSKLREIIGTPTAHVSTENGETIFIKNTDRLLWSDEEVIGGKTGYTLKAKHCFVCAARHKKKRISSWESKPERSLARDRKTYCQGFWEKSA